MILKIVYTPSVAKVVATRSADWSSDGPQPETSPTGQHHGGVVPQFASRRHRTITRSADLARTTAP
jgi:hypothetical protein